MKIRGCLPIGSWFLVVASGLISPAAFAELKTFTVDHSQSHLTVTASMLGVSLTPQLPGSMSNRYTGTIQADVTGSTIQFMAGSMIICSNFSSALQPAEGGAAGSFAANYGGQATVPIAGVSYAAIRRAQIDAESTNIPFSGTNFTASGIVFSFISNSLPALDYRVGSGGPPFGAAGSVPLSNRGTNSVTGTASLATVGPETVLTIPIDYTGTVAVTGGTITYRLVGQFVAKATAAVPLSIGAFTVSPGQLSFTITTVPGQSYTILGSTNLPTFNIIIDQFTATNSPTTRNIVLPVLPEQFFIIRQD